MIHQRRIKATSHLMPIKEKCIDYRFPRGAFVCWLSSNSFSGNIIFISIKLKFIDLPEKVF